MNQRLPQLIFVFLFACCLTVNASSRSFGQEDGQDMRLDRYVGTVVDWNGEPVNAAWICSRYVERYSECATQSDEQGRFTVQGPMTEDVPFFVIWAYSPLHGICGVEIEESSQNKLALKFKKPESVEIKILNPWKKPISDLKVAVAQTFIEFSDQQKDEVGANGLWDHVPEFIWRKALVPTDPDGIAKLPFATKSLVSQFAVESEEFGTQFLNYNFESDKYLKVSRTTRVELKINPNDQVDFEGRDVYLTAKLAGATSRHRGTVKNNQITFSKVVAGDGRLGFPQNEQDKLWLNYPRKITLHSIKPYKQTLEFVQPVTVSGTIVADKKPISGIEISLDGIFGKSATTDRQGRFQSTLLPGEHIFEIPYLTADLNKTYFTPKPKKFTTTDQPTFDLGNIELGKLIELEGTLVDPKGHPVNGGYIRLLVDRIDVLDEGKFVFKSEREAKELSEQWIYWHQSEDSNRGYSAKMISADPLKFQLRSDPNSK